MKKTIFGYIIIFFVIIAIYRVAIVGTTNYISIANIVEEIGRQGEITTINDIFQDTQKLKYNYNGLVNFMQVKNDYYEVYTIKESNTADTGQRLIDEIKPIKQTANAKTYYVFVSKQYYADYEEDNTDIFSTVKKIANNVITFFKYIGNMIKFTGNIIVDVLKCVIESLAYATKVLQTLFTGK